jgi:hypothetical protein
MANAPICLIISEESYRNLLVQIRVLYTMTTLISKACPNPFVLSFKTWLVTEETIA